LLGELNDRVSDLRAAEAEVLLSCDATVRDTRFAEVTNLANAAREAVAKALTEKVISA
jgi:hypothetical protein